MPQQLGNSSQSRSTSVPLGKVTRGHSCTLCSQRKVRCDGKRPCSTCIKSSRASECRSSRPAVLTSLARDGPGSREHALIQRLRHYEGLLTAHGIPITAGRGTDDESKPGTEATSPTPKSDDGHVIMQRGHPRFVDNAIWNPLGSEFDDEYYAGIDEDDQSTQFEEQAPASPETLLLAQWTLDVPDNIYTGPDIAQTLKLWQIFLDNFNPLVKLFHAPSIQQLICEAIAADPCNVAKSTKALMAAIYLCAVTTLTDEECISQLSESKTTLLRRFSCLAQQALVQAEFLRTTDPAVLQALTLYLVSSYKSPNLCTATPSSKSFTPLRVAHEAFPKSPNIPLAYSSCLVSQVYEDALPDIHSVQLASRRQLDEQSLWLLTGLATRLAQAMGSHREQSLKQISPFEAELRRRLWWQIVIMDSRSGQLLGATGGSSFSDDADAKIPANVNDSDLSPYMREPLASHDGPTEMLFCTIRLKIGNCMRRLRIAGSTSTTLTDKEELIDALDKTLESTLKQCDPSIPLHLMSVFLGRSAICQMRFSTLQGDQNEKSPETRAKLFHLALEILGYDSLTYSNKSLQRFLWHVGNSFPFQALIYVLTDLLKRPPGGDDAQQAWARVNRVYEDHPELIGNSRNPLCFALGSLTLKAWGRHAQEEPPPPGDGTQAPAAAAAARAVPMSPAIARLQSQRAARAPGGGAALGSSPGFVQQPGSDQGMYAWPQAAGGGGGAENDAQLGGSGMQFFSRCLAEDSMVLWGSQGQQW